MRNEDYARIRTTVLELAGQCNLKINEGKNIEVCIGRNWFVTYEWEQAYYFLLGVQRQQEASKREQILKEQKK